MNYDLKVIVTKEILADPVRLNRVIENQMDMAAEGMRVDFEVTVQTWKRQPEFTIFRARGQRVVGTTDTIYKFLNGGTRVRRAVMTPGFRAKTVPGKIKSRVGRGERRYVSVKLALPGIQPRQFSDTVAKKWRKLFRIQLQRAFDVELRSLRP